MAKAQQQPLLPGLQPSAPAPHTAPRALDDARALMRNGRFREAALALRGMLTDHADCAECAELLAYALLRDNQPAESLKVYTQAAALRPPSAVTLRNVAQDYALLNDLSDADRWIRRAAQMDPHDADTLYSLGRIVFSEQMYADAVAAFQRVLTLSPRSVKAANNLGLAYEGLDRMDDAVAAYRQAISWQADAPVSGQSEQPLLNLAIVLLHAGKLTEAEALLRQAVAIAPADGRIHEQLGHLYMQQDQFTAAEGELKLAVQADPQSSSLHFLLGQAYRKLGLHEQADSEFAAAQQLASRASALRPR